MKSENNLAQMSCAECAECDDAQGSLPPMAHRKWLIPETGGGDRECVSKETLEVKREKKHLIVGSRGL
jgi:hypothetical protein